MMTKDDLRIFVTKDQRVLISRGKGPLMVVDQAGDVSEQYRIEGTCYYDDGQSGWDSGYDAGYSRGHDEGYEQASRDAAKEAAGPTAVAS